MNRETTLLIANTALELSAAEKADPTGKRNYTGLREHAEQLTDLLIRSMYPNYASGGIPRQDRRDAKSRLRSEQLPPVLSVCESREIS